MAGADRFEDLRTWQRMYELSVEVWRATNAGPASRDFDFRREVRDASDSAHRNVAEGFGRYSPPQFLQFLDVARASAQETRALLRKGLVVGYLTEDQFARLDILAARGLQSLAKLQRYLRTPEARRNAGRRRHQRQAVSATPSQTPAPDASPDLDDTNDAE
jgi:four helix bundle protein